MTEPSDCHCHQNTVCVYSGANSVCLSKLTVSSGLTGLCQPQLAAPGEGRDRLNSASDMETNFGEQGRPGREREGEGDSIKYQIS